MWNIKEQFESDGYVLLEDFLEESEADELRAECEKLIEAMPEQAQRPVFNSSIGQQSRDEYFLQSADKISFFFEKDALGPDGSLKVDPKLSLNKIGHALHVLNPVFRRITFDERVKECCFQLGFQEPAVAQSMYIFKNPGLGSEVVAHQDASYLYTEPVKIAGFWLALEDATLENGCLWFSKGSHKSGVHRRYIRNPDKDSEDLLIYTAPAPIYQRSGFTPVPVKKGSCLLIHGQVVHYSDANKSKNSRHAYTFHVIEQLQTKYSEENWLQTPNQPFLSLYKN